MSWIIFLMQLLIIEKKIEILNVRTVHCIKHISKKIFNKIIKE